MWWSRKIWISDVSFPFCNCTLKSCFIERGGMEMVVFLKVRSLGVQRKGHQMLKSWKSKALTNSSGFQLQYADILGFLKANEDVASFLYAPRYGHPLRMQSFFCSFCKIPARFCSIPWLPGSRFTGFKQLNSRLAIGWVEVRDVTHFSCSNSNIAGSYDVSNSWRF